MSSVLDLLAGLFSRRRNVVLPIVVLAVAAAFAPSAYAGYVPPYDLENFSFFSTDPTVTDPRPFGLPLILTGPNYGAGLTTAWYTELTIAARGTGVFEFHWIYNTRDLPEYDGAGYLLNGAFTQFTSTDGESGHTEVSVRAGDLIGWRVFSVDDQGEPGVLTILDFSAPVPEPASIWLTATAVAAFLVGQRWVRSRRKSPIRLTLFVAVITLGSGAHGLRAQSQADFTGSDITGALRFARVVNIRQQPVGLLRTTANSGEDKKLRYPPPRLRPPQGSALAGAAAAATPTVRSLAIRAALPRSSFNALSHLDQRLANSGNQFSVEPPSQSLAVGNGYVLEGVNNAIQIYTASGTPALSYIPSTNQLFGLGPAIDWNTGVNGVYLTDMRVYYDSTINRWFVLQRSQDNNAQGVPLPQSHIYLAVSRSGDPTGEYLIYVMDTTNGSHPGCPCIADYPQIGSDQYGLHIAWNEFNAYSTYPVFVDGVIMSISKAALETGSLTPNAYQFTLPFTTGYEFAIQPATTPPGAGNFVGSGGLEYLVSSSARYFGASGVALWALRNTSSLATPAPFLVLSRIIVPTLPYAPPDVATQRVGPLPLGSSLNPLMAVPFLDGGDSRIQSLTYAGARLYLTLQTGLTDEVGRFVGGVAYIVLSPVFRNSLLSALVLNQGYLCVSGNHLLRPALAVNAKGRGAVAVTVTGPDWYPSAASIPFETFTTPSVLEVSAPGTLPEDGFTAYPQLGGQGVARWGDYNGAVAVADGSIWMVAEYIGSYPRTPAANWNTYIFQTMP